jgi:hypothetical protein
MLTIQMWLKPLRLGRRAVGLCLNMGYQGAIFEGDSLNVVSGLRSTGPCWSGFSQLIEDTKIKLKSFE